MGNTVMVTVLLLVIPIGGILLQIFLSKRESKWPGLVLPGITLLYSLAMVLGAAAYGGVAETLGILFASLTLGNIPTLVLLAIYWACREKRRVKSQMDKTRIDDL